MNIVVQTFGQRLLSVQFTLLSKPHFEAAGAEADEFYLDVIFYNFGHVFIAVHGSGVNPQEILPDFVKLHEEDANIHYEEGDLVELHVVQDSSLIYGVIKWIGYSPNKSDTAKMAGIELEEELHGATNGWHNGSQLFACADRKAIFVPLTHVTPDKRFEASRHSVIPDQATNGLKNGHHNGEFGDMDCPLVPGFHGPIKTDDLMLFCGRNRGIQGHQNSCYLDATLFAMFSFTR